MDQKQYNFIEVKKRGKGKQNSKKVGKKALFRFYWHLLSSCSRFFSLCRSGVSPLCPIHLLLPLFSPPHSFGVFDFSTLLVYWLFPLFIRVSERKCMSDIDIDDGYDNDCIAFEIISSLSALGNIMALPIRSRMATVGIHFGSTKILL